MIYLDAAATTPVRREVIEAMWPYLTGEFGNASSSHGLGDAAARALAASRASVAEWLGCRPSEVVFTSGGTESDNLAIKGIALANPRGRHLVTSAIEHEAVLESADYLARHHGFSLSVLPVDASGLVSLGDLAAALRPDTTLVSVQTANNEVGTVQPIAELAAVARAAGVPFHTDAVQAAGAIDVRVDSSGVDALSLSGHKLGAPKGVGVLYVRGRLAVEPLVHGGGQERGIRSGTENVAGAVALARALSLLTPPPVALRDAFIDEVLASVPDARLTGHREHRLPGHASFTLGRASGEAVLLELERRGVICSSGSACAAGSDEPSPVLLALGIDATVAQTAVRFTFDASTTAADLSGASAALRDSLVSIGGLR